MDLSSSGALTSADAVGSATSLAMIDGLPVAFAMIDIDHLKTFNDTHGHAAGDAPLQTVAQVIESCVRSTDVVHRYGGEEFSVLSPGANPEEARAVVERVRAEVEAARVTGSTTSPTTSRRGPTRRSTEPSPQAAIGSLTPDGPETLRPGGAR